MNKNLILRVLKNNYRLFPYLVFLSYFFLFVESCTYSGFFWKNLLINTKIFVVITMLSAVGVELYSDRKKMSKSCFMENLIFNLNLLLLPIFGISYITMQVSEQKHFINYVYSTFHLQPNNFFLLTVFSLYIVLINLFGKLVSFERSEIYIKPLKRSNRYTYAFLRKNLTYFIAVVLLGRVFVSDNIYVAKSVINSNLYIITHLSKSYDQKMEGSWGFYYDYMKFVSEHISPGSTILVPPQESPWLSTGNAGLDRYFVYPSYVTNGGYNTLGDSNIKYQYILIAHGEWLVADTSRYGWPKVAVKAEKIWYYDPITTKISEVDNKTYYPNDKTNPGAWGLIKVKND